MVHQVVCQGCGKTFTAKRADARFHDTACRARSFRQRTDLLEINPIKTALEAVLAFELRVQQVGQDVGLLQGARRGALVTALAAIEAELAPWRESDPSGYESALVVARANAERVTRARREALAETVTLVETSTPEAAESVQDSNASMETTESPTLAETTTSEAVESAQDSNTSTETTETPTLAETTTSEAAESVLDSNASTETTETPDTSEPKRVNRSRVRTAKTLRHSADDIEGLRAGLKAALTAGLSQRTIADEIGISQSQISRFAAGHGLSDKGKNGLANWLNKKRY